MTHTPNSAADEIDRYLRSGEYDDFYLAWPGDDLFARGRNGSAALRGALIATVRSRTVYATTPNALIGTDMIAFMRAKVASMVKGLFPQDEQAIVLNALAHSLIFLTPDTIGNVLRETQWHGTAWKLANLYLASYDAVLLSDDAPQLVGLSEATTCYVSVKYFQTQNRFDDFVLHEAAHIFHNCKRQTIGLRAIRGREWLLDIDFSLRETFAYACEAYSRILALGSSPVARRVLLSELVQESAPPDDRVDADLYQDILGGAIASRNGWKHILQRCLSSRQNRRPEMDRA